jgi:glycosyltransferase involved in cell wall biosynthesis
MKDLISIVIPVYNVSQYLDKCLDSIIKQTYENIEIICVENNSTDDSAAKLKIWQQKDSRIILAHSLTQGLSASRNVGIKLATGKYISFVDSDDYLELDAIYNLYNGIIKHDCDVAIAKSITLDDNSLELNYNDAYFSISNYFQHENYREKINIKQILKCKFPMFPVMAWGKLFKTSIFHNNSLLFKEGCNFEDQIFTYELIFKIKNIACVDKFAYVYRINRVGSIVYDRSHNLDKITQVLYAYLYGLQSIYANNKNYRYYKILKTYLKETKYYISSCNFKEEDLKNSKLHQVLSLINDFETMFDQHPLNRYKKLYKQFTHKIKQIIKYYSQKIKCKLLIIRKS